MEPIRSPWMLVFRSFYAATGGGQQEARSAGSSVAGIGCVARNAS